MLIYSIIQLLYIHLAYCIPITLISENVNYAQLNRRLTTVLYGCILGIVNCHEEESNIPVVRSASAQPEKALRSASVNNSPSTNQVQSSYVDYFKNYGKYEVDFNQDSEGYSYQH